MPQAGVTVSGLIIAVSATVESLRAAGARGVPQQAEKHCGTLDTVGDFCDS